MKFPIALSVTVTAIAGAVCSPLAWQEPARKQLIAHRGASAYAPEHTLDAYRLAIAQGADFVEQDLAVTKDGVLVCIHDLTLERTTNVEEIFPDRSVAAPAGTGAARRWLAGDFTLAEIKQLDAGSWFDPKFAGSRVPTFQEAIDLVRGRAGLYPELKDPAFYRDRGLKPEKLLADMLKKNSLIAEPKTPVIIQSFDEVTIKALSRDLPEVPRVWLVEPVDSARLDSADKVKAIGAWATGIAPNKAIVAARPEVVSWAHDAGLTVTLWTFRSSGTGSVASVRAEMEKFLYDYGVDAVFTDNPDQFPRR